MCISALRLDGMVQKCVTLLLRASFSVHRKQCCCLCLPTKAISGLYTWWSASQRANSSLWHFVLFHSTLMKPRQTEEEALCWRKAAQDSVKLGWMGRLEPFCVEFSCSLCACKDVEKHPCKVNFKLVRGVFLSMNGWPRCSLHLNQSEKPNQTRGHSDLHFTLSLFSL